MTNKKPFNEDLVLRDERTGRVILCFPDYDIKQEFLNNLKSIYIRTKRNKDEGYRCGHCAAYPCFRMTSESEPTGLCFQPVKQCRQECKNYISKTIDGFTTLANGGNCRIDKQDVAYCQECHIPNIRDKSRL